MLDSQYAAAGCQSLVSPWHCDCPELICAAQGCADSWPQSRRLVAVGMEA